MSRTSVPHLVGWNINIRVTLDLAIDVLQQATCDSVEEADRRALAIEEMQMWRACTGTGRNASHLPRVVHLSPEGYATQTHTTVNTLNSWVNVIKAAQKDLEAPRLRDFEGAIYRLLWLIDRIE